MNSVNQNGRQRCFYCGAGLYSPEECMKFTLHPWRFPHRFTIDHKIARFNGGDDSPENRVNACHSCNFAKSTLTVEEFRARLAESFPAPIVFYGEGGLLERTLAYSGDSVLRWSNGDLNACRSLCQRARKTPELMVGNSVELDPVVEPCGVYRMGKGMSGYTVITENGTIVAQTTTDARSERLALSRLITQANTVTKPIPKKRGKK